MCMCANLYKFHNKSMGLQSGIGVLEGLGLVLIICWGEWWG